MDHESSETPKSMVVPETPKSMVVPESPSAASCSIQRAAAKRKKNSILHGFNWKQTEVFNIREHGGKVIEENEEVIFKVPEPASKKSRSQTRYGEQICPRISPQHLKPLETLTPASLQRHRQEMMKRIYLAEQVGENLSDMVVDLYLRRLSRYADASRLRSLQSGKRCETIPCLPPFAAFDNTAPLRSSLTEKDTARLFPLRDVFREYHKEANIKRYTPGPSMDGLEHVADACGAAVFRVESVSINPKRKLLVSVNMLDVHVFNTHARELTALSGLVLPPPNEPQVLPDITAHFFFDNVFRRDNAIAAPPLSMTTAAEGDDDTSDIMPAIPRKAPPPPPPPPAPVVPPPVHKGAGAGQGPSVTCCTTVAHLQRCNYARLYLGGCELIPVFCKRLARAVMPVQAQQHQGFLEYTNKGFKKLESSVLAANPVLSEMLRIPGFLRHEPRFAEYIARQKVDSPNKLRHVELHFQELLRMWVKWRYFGFPDLVAACLLVDYVISNPSVTKDVFIRCPAVGRKLARRNKRVCLSERINDPSSLMLFENFAAKGFDVYGASMLLYKLVCGTKSHQLHISRQASKQKSDRAADSKDSSSSSEDDEDSKHKTGKGAKIKPIRSELLHKISVSVVFKHMSPSQHEQGEAGATAAPPEDSSDDNNANHTASLTQKPRYDFARLVDLVVQQLPVLYSWRRYPELCTSTRLSSKNNQISSEPAPAAPAPAPAPQSLPPAPAKEGPSEAENTPQDPQYERKLFKSIMLGRAVPLMPRSKVRGGKLENLEQVLRLFEANITLVGEKELAHLGRRPSTTATPRMALLAVVLNMYVSEKKLLVNPDEPLRDKDIKAFIVANRSQCPGLERYTHANRSLLFRVKPTTEFGAWYEKLRAKWAEEAKSHGANKHARTLEQAVDKLAAMQDNDSSLSHPSASATDSRSKSSSSSSDSESSSSSSSNSSDSESSSSSSSSDSESSSSNSDSESSSSDSESNNKERAE